MHDIFFMVLAENSSETRQRHATLDIARNEAKRLAGKNPGVKFFVLAALGHMVKEDPVTWRQHEPSDEIPF
jgi:hypothetical protein